MLDEQSAANRWLIRLIKLWVIASAIAVVVWYMLQFRGTPPPKPKSPTQQVTILRDRTENLMARRVAAESVDLADTSIVRELTTELSEGDANGRELAALALGRLGADESSAVDGLVAALDDPEQQVRQQATTALLAVLRRRGRPRFRSLQGLLTHASADVRRQAAIEAGEIPDADGDVLGAVRGCLSDPDARVRAEAFAALSRQSAVSLDELIAGLHDSDLLVQSTACTLLGRMDGHAKPAIEELGKLVAANGASAWAAGQALLKIDDEDPEVVSLLVPLLDADDRQRVVDAERLFLKLGHLTTIVRQRLLALVDDPREYVSDYALWALRRTGLEGRLQPPELINALEEAGQSVLSLQLHDEEIAHDRAYGLSFYYPTRLVGFGVTDRDLARLGGLHNLRLLDVSANPVGDAGLESIAGLENLEWLFLYDTKTTSAGLAHLVGMTRLRSLALGGCEITDEGLEYLEQLPALEALDLRRTKITDAGMRHLAACKRLKAIWLEETQVTNDGLAPLAELPLLEDLGYLSKQFTLRGLSQLKQLVTVRPPPESVVDDDLALLAGMPRLRELILSGASVTDEGLEHIGKLTQLESLWLNGTKITDAGLPSLRSLVNLKHLYLPSSTAAGIGMGPARQTGISERGLESLQQALPKLEWPLATSKTQVSTTSLPYKVAGLKLDDEADTVPSVP